MPRPAARLREHVGDGLHRVPLLRSDLRLDVLRRVPPARLYGRAADLRSDGRELLWAADLPRRGLVLRDGLQLSRDSIEVGAKRVYAVGHVRKRNRADPPAAVGPGVDRRGRGSRVLTFAGRA